MISWYQLSHDIVYDFRKTGETWPQISWFPSATSARPAASMSATTAKGKGRTVTSRGASERFGYPESPVYIMIMDYNCTFYGETCCIL